MYFDLNVFLSYLVYKLLYYSLKTLTITSTTVTEFYKILVVRTKLGNIYL